MTRTEDAAEALRARLRADPRSAMKRRDALEISTLRCLIGAVDNAGAVMSPNNGRHTPGDWSEGSAYVVTGSDSGPTEVAHRALTADKIEALLKHEREARTLAAAILKAIGFPLIESASKWR